MLPVLSQSNGNPNDGIRDGKLLGANRASPNVDAAGASGKYCEPNDLRR